MLRFIQIRTEKEREKRWLDMSECHLKSPYCILLSALVEKIIRVSAVSEVADERSSPFASDALPESRPRVRHNCDVCTEPGGKLFLTSFPSPKRLHTRMHAVLFKGATHYTNEMLTLENVPDVISTSIQISVAAIRKCHEFF